MFTYLVENVRTHEKEFLTCFTVLFIGDEIQWKTDRDTGKAATWRVVR